MSDIVRNLAKLQIEALASLRDLSTPEGLMNWMSEMGYDIQEPDELLQAMSLSLIHI